MKPHTENKQIMPWWLKLVLLLILGLPGFTGWPNGWAVQELQATKWFTLEIAHVVVWVAYAGLVWLVVLICAGQHKLLNYLGAAFVLALTVAILGAILRSLIPPLAGGLSKEAVSFKMIRIFINITIFLPYSVLFINSFSAKKLIDRVAELEGRYRTMGLHLALAFRVFQHTGEVVFNLFQIWTEEYPEKILPRQDSTQMFRWYAPRNLLTWVWDCVHAWIFACIIHTFEPIPAMVAEVERIDRTSKNHKDTKDTKGNNNLD